MTHAAHVIRSVSNTHADRELERIHWRRRVLESGGQAWLLERAREAKFRERDLGPHRLTYPEATP